MAVTMNQKELIKHYYDAYADVYGRKHGVAGTGQAYNFRRYYEPFLKKTVPSKGKVLEVGCGTGIYTRWLIAQGFDVVGIDISPGMLQKARCECPEASFYEGDCENPAAFLEPETIGDGFDAIIGINAFSYYPNKEAALLNYRDLFRADGRLILIDMNGVCPFYKIMAWMNINEMEEWYDQIKQSRQDYLTRILKSANYQVNLIEHFAFLPNGLGKRSVDFLAWFDQIASSMIGLRKMAMRIAVVATKVEMG